MSRNPRIDLESELDDFYGEDGWGYCHHCREPTPEYDLNGHQACTLCQDLWDTEVDSLEGEDAE